MLLDINDLKVAFTTGDGDVNAVNGISYGIDAGETLAIVGESGSGKSMTAFSVMRLLPQAAKIQGAIYLEDEDLCALSEVEMCQRRGRDIGMVFQEPMTALNPVKTIGEQVAEGIREHTNASRAEAEDRADVTISEKYRRILEAYQVENEYGRTIEAYQAELTIDGAKRSVDFLRVGRVALMFQSLDAGLTGYYDPASKDFVIDNDYKTAVRDGLRIARKQTAPDLLLVPAAAPADL